MNPFPFSGITNILAWKAAANHIRQAPFVSDLIDTHAPATGKMVFANTTERLFAPARAIKTINGHPSKSTHVAMPTHIRPVFRKHLPTKLVYLYLPDGLKPARLFQSKLDATDTCE
jgi:hypothetical protein